MKIKDLEVGSEIYIFDNNDIQLNIIEIIDIEQIDEESAFFTFVDHNQRMHVETFDLNEEVNGYEFDNYVLFVTQGDCYKAKIAEYSKKIELYVDIVNHMKKELKS